jgi:pimeloyl-ACP methyl ester carboxylesterase
MPNGGTGETPALPASKAEAGLPRRRASYNERMRENSVIANGIRLRYVDWEGSGPDVVLVHPTGFVADIWAPLAEELSSRYHVVALDCRGHGDSDKPEQYSICDLVDDLGAFIVAAGLRQPIGIGHSAGATSIAGLEAKRPDCFQAVVLMDPVLSYDQSTAPRTLETDPLARGALKRRAVWPNREEIYQAYRSKPPFETWNERPLREYIEHGFRDRDDGSVELKCSPESEAGMYLRGAHTLAAGEIIPKVRCPALLLRGQKSHVFSDAISRRTLGLLPRGSLVNIPGGHFAPFEHTDVMVDAVGSLLRDLEQISAQAGPEAAAG